MVLGQSAEAATVLPETPTGRSVWNMLQNDIFTPV